MNRPNCPCAELDLCSGLRAKRAAPKVTARQHSPLLKAHALAAVALKRTSVVYPIRLEGAIDETTVRLMPFDYTPEQLTALERMLSVERFQPYLLKAGGSRLRAIKLYERNTALAEGMYAVIQAAEVALRNAIHSSLAEAAGRMWFEKIELEEAQLARIREAKSELLKVHAEPPAAAIVAGLRFGFWTALLSARYEKLLWVRYLHRAFPGAWVDVRNERGDVVKKKKVDTSEIHLIAEEIRTLRNPIADHEPIFNMDLWRSYTNALKLISWVCPTSSEWVASTNCFRSRVFEKEELAVQKARATPEDNRPRPGLPEPGR